MRIKKLHIHGFGIFRDLSIENMEHDLVVFTGNNESGKSTLRRFIKGCLFGMKGQKGCIDEPLNGGPHGGYMDVSLKDYRASRLVLQGRKLYEEKTGSGDPVYLETGPLWTGVSRDLYERVFSIGLEELDRGGNRFLDEETVRNRLFSATAGLGNISLRDIFSSLSVEMKDLNRVRGKTSRSALPSTRQKLSRINEEIWSLRDMLEEYADLLKKREDLNDQLESLSENIEKIRNSLVRFDKLERLYDLWIELKMLRSRKEELKWAGKFPPAGKERYLELSRTIEKTEETIRSGEILLEGKKKELAAVRINTYVLNHDNEIEKLRDERALISELPEKKAVLEEKIVSLRSSLDEWSTRMGPSWNMENITEVDISNIAAAEASRYASRKEELINSLSSCENALKEIREHINTILKELEKREIEIDSLGDVLNMRMGAEELARKSDQARDIAGRITALQEKRIYLERTLEQVQNEIEEERKKACNLSLPFSFTFLLSTLLVMSGGIACFIFFFEPSYFSAAITAIACLPFAGAFIANMKGRISNQWARRRSEENILSCEKKRDSTLEDLDECDRRHELMAGQLVEVLHDLEPGSTDIPGDMDEIQSMLGNYDKLIRQLERELQRRASLDEELGYLKERETALLDRFKEHKGQMEELCSNWKEWLISHGLPDNVDPGGFYRLEQSVLTIRRLIESLEELSSESERVKRLLEEKESLVKSLISCAGLECGTCHPSVRLDLLISVLSKSRKQYDVKKSIEESIAKIESGLDSEKEALCERRQKLKTLLQSAVCEDENSFFRMSEDYIKLKQTEEELRTTKSEMTGIAGGEKLLEECCEELEMYDLETIRDKKEKLTVSLGSARERYSKLQRELGAVDTRIEDLSANRRQSLLFQEREFLNSEGYALSLKWAGLALCRYMLEKAREKYEKEKQPQVVDVASGYMNIITGGRYELILSAEDNRIVLKDLFRESRKERTEWSSGLADQAFICIRLALASVLGQLFEPLPMVLDDIHLRFDPCRQAGLSKVLLDHSKNDQILLFSCNPEFASIMSEKARKAEKSILFCHLENGELVSVHAG